MGVRHVGRGGVEGEAHASGARVRSPPSPLLLEPTRPTGVCSLLSGETQAPARGTKARGYVPPEWSPLPNAERVGGRAELGETPMALVSPVPVFTSSLSTGKYVDAES